MYTLIEFLEMDNEICQQQCLQDPYIQNQALYSEEWDTDDDILQDYTSPKDMQEHTNPSLLINDEKSEQSNMIPLQYNQSQHMEKPTICNEGLNHKEKD